MSNAYTVFIAAEAWAVGAVRDGHIACESVAFDADPARSGPQARAEALAGKLAQMGRRDEPVLLAPASAMCLCAPISTEGLERGKRRQAMAFRLEESLPVSAEEIVADYVCIGKDQALGVCCELSDLAETLDALALAGVNVRHICPMAFLIAADAARELPGADGVLVAHDDIRSGWDLVPLASGKPQNWWWLADDGPELDERLTAWAASFERAPRLAVLAGDPSALASVVPDGIDVLESDQAEPASRAAREGAKVLAGERSPWADLRRDALAPPQRWGTYRRPVTALVAAMAGLLICISVAMCWRGRGYASLADRYSRRQVAAFREVFADRRVPPDIETRLRAHHRKLAHLSGRSLGEDELLAMRSPGALTQLRQILAALPGDVRYRILDLKIEQTRIRVEGEARDYADAERVALALRDSGRYDVELPHTETLRERGVSFDFSARPIQTDKQEAP